MQQVAKNAGVAYMTVWRLEKGYSYRESTLEKVLGIFE